MTALACCFLMLFLLFLVFTPHIDGLKEPERSVTESYSQSVHLPTLYFCLIILRQARTHTHTHIRTHMVMGTVSELCVSSFQAFLCPSPRAPTAASGETLFFSKLHILGPHSTDAVGVAAVVTVKPFNKFPAA